VNDWSEVDRRLGLPDDYGIERLARAMEDEHKHQDDPTAAWRSLENRKRGLFGQRHMARMLELPMDTSVRKFGTKQAPFTLRDGTRVATITRSPVRGKSSADLTVPWPPRTNADCFVLILWHGNEQEPTVAGWASKDRVEQGHVGVYRDGLENRVLYPVELRPLPELIARHNPQSPWAMPTTVLQQMTLF
jgi:hypothetical protein